MARGAGWLSVSLLRRCFMYDRECLRCGALIDARDSVCGSCGASWPVLAGPERSVESGTDEAVVWVLGAMLTIVAFFLFFVAW